MGQSFKKTILSANVGEIQSKINEYNKKHVSPSKGADSKKNEDGVLHIGKHGAYVRPGKEGLLQKIDRSFTRAEDNNLAQLYVESAGINLFKKLGLPVDRTPNGILAEFKRSAFGGGESGDGNSVKIHNLSIALDNLEKAVLEKTKDIERKEEAKRQDEMKSDGDSGKFNKIDELLSAASSLPNVENVNRGDCRNIDEISADGHPDSAKKILYDSSSVVESEDISEMTSENIAIETAPIQDDSVNLAEEQKKQRFRNQICAEIFTTEQTYQKNLKSADIVFKGLLENDTEDDTKDLTVEGMSQSLDIIVQSEVKLLKDLRETEFLKKFPDIKGNVEGVDAIKIADAFIKFAENKKNVAAYCKYASIFDSIMKRPWLNDKLKKHADTLENAPNKKADELRKQADELGNSQNEEADELRKRADKLDEEKNEEIAAYQNFSASAITVIQRLPRYLLLLKALQEYYSSDSEEYTKIQSALSTIGIMANSLNETVRAKAGIRQQTDNQYNFEKLQKMMLEKNDKSNESHEKMILTMMETYPSGNGKELNEEFKNHHSQMKKQFLPLLKKRLAENVKQMKDANANAKTRESLSIKNTNLESYKNMLKEKYV
jgi:hypothetical protein